MRNWLRAVLWKSGKLPSAIPRIGSSARRAARTTRGLSHFGHGSCMKSGVHVMNWLHSVGSIIQLYRWDERLVLAGHALMGGWPNSPHRVIANSTFEHWRAAGCPPNGLRPGEGERIGTFPVRRADVALQCVGAVGNEGLRPGGGSGSMRYGSISTPGLSMPCGSNSRLAARSAAAKSSGRCRSYQGL